MNIFTEILLAAAICIALFFAVWSAKRLFLTPVKCGKEIDVVVIIEASGDAPTLEQTVRGLLCLRNDSRSDWSIAIRDCGMLPDACRRAELIARDHCFVAFENMHKADTWSEKTQN